MKVRFGFRNEWPPNELVKRAVALPSGYAVKFGQFAESVQGHPIPRIVCYHETRRNLKRFLKDVLTLTPKATIGTDGETFS